MNQPKTKVELSINFQDRPYYARTLSSAGITYMWTNSRYSSFSLRPIDINVVDMTRPVDPEFLGNTSNKYLINSFKTQFIGGLSFGYGYNNQRKNLGGNATNIRFNAETAGNLIDAVEHAFFSPAKGKEQYTIFGIEYSQYFRTDLSVSRKIMLGALRRWWDGFTAVWRWLTETLRPYLSTASSIAAAATACAAGRPEPSGRVRWPIPTTIFRSRRAT